MFAHLKPPNSARLSRSLIGVMLAADVRAWDKAAQDLFTYVGDGVFDTWRSYAYKVLENERWTGDCDDLTSTVLDLLGRRGVPLSQRYRLLVDSAHQGSADHMIGCVLTSDRQFMIVGDTFAPAHGAAMMRHRPVFYQRMDEWTADGEPVWRDGTPWRTA